MRGGRIVVMAKAPVPGYAKTRLIAALGEVGAARLAERLLAAAVAQALAADAGEVELCCAPDTSHAAFVALARDGRVQLAPQGEGDLGVRMQRAFERGLALAERVVLVGTDAPALTDAYLRRAQAALADHDAVLGPAADGGYVLIGLRRAAPQLFDDMPWSTPEVLMLTRARLAAAGLRHVELPPLHDIDEAADLAFVPPQWL